jgi:hypothetical protein
VSDTVADIAGRMRRDDETIRECIAKFGDRPFSVSDVLTEWMEWGCTYERRPARDMIRHIIRQQLEAGELSSYMTTRQQGGSRNRFSVREYRRTA